jgi:hypothetical protein
MRVKGKIAETNTKTASGLFLAVLSKAKMSPIPEVKNL